MEDEIMRKFLSVNFDIYKPKDMYKGAKTTGIALIMVFIPMFLFSQKTFYIFMMPILILQQRKMRSL